MPAKKPAPKPGRSKKPAPRAVARKAAPRKPVERAKIVAHPRAKAAAVPARKPAAASHPSESTSATSSPARKTPDSVAAPALQPPPPSPPPAPQAPHAVAVRPSQAAGAIDGDDADAAEPGSLLAGPRNVKPYIAKRGEQYMSKEQTEHFRQILHNWKRDLMEEVDRTVTHMKDEAANFPDPNDRATQEEEFSLELRTRDRERKLIRKIDEALKRIEDGTYGYCLETGEEIGIKRLEARPVATLSIEAQERRERRERQYGDRDDRYR
ncbi:MAG TPA: RNA polymerase-binding protein DksA [Steroidobacteraceae bacterium]|nr:RNA polymerase-binding protein DksA [Steroidobacteraceae bacterium]